MEDRAEFPQPNEGAKETVKELLERLLREGRVVAFPVLDMEGNEWTYRCMVSEALTIIKYKKDGEKQPAITLRESNSGFEFDVISVNSEGIRKKVSYGNDGKIKSTEDLDPELQKEGAYLFEKLPQNINIKKTARMFLEGFRLVRGELPKLAPAEPKPLVTESKPAEPKAAQSQPVTRKAA